MQLTIQNQKRGAYFFALGASLTEFVYAGITVRFQIFLSERPIITDNFIIISAIGMLTLGVLNLMGKSNSKKILPSEGLKGRRGFRQGVILSILNPLTIPFWLAVTAYLQSNNWITLNGSLFWAYLIGISTGTFALLLTIRALGSKFENIAENSFLVYKVPGMVFIILGIYNIFGWLQ